MSKRKTPATFDPSTVVQTLDRIADLLDGADERLSGQVRAAVSELWGSKPGSPPAACVWYTHAVRTVHDRELAAHLASAAGAVGSVLSGNDPLLCNLVTKEAARRIRSTTGWLKRNGRVRGPALSDTCIAVVNALAEMHPRPMHISRIRVTIENPNRNPRLMIGTPNCDHKSIRSAIGELENNRLVTFPTGPRSGLCLTDAGLAVTKSPACEPRK